MHADHRNSDIADTTLRVERDRSKIAGKMPILVQ